MIETMYNVHHCFPAWKNWSFAFRLQQIGFGSLSVTNTTTNQDDCIKIMHRQNKLQERIQNHFQLSKCCQLMYATIIIAMINIMLLLLLIKFWCYYTFDFSTIYNNTVQKGGKKNIQQLSLFPTRHLCRLYVPQWLVFTVHFASHSMTGVNLQYIVSKLCTCKRYKLVNMFVDGPSIVSLEESIYKLLN